MSPFYSGGQACYLTESGVMFVVEAAKVTLCALGRPAACYLSLDWTLMAGSGERHHRMFTGFKNYTFATGSPGTLL